MTTERKKTPRWVWTVLKLLVAACVVAWMFHKGVIRLDDLRNAAGNWPLLAAALAAILTCVFVQSARWCILLRAQGIDIRVPELYKLAMTGLFFTMIAPGGIGGDAIKAYFVARGREKKAEAATTVFLDRFLGLATLFLVACIVIVIDLDRLWHAKLERLSYFGLPGGRVLVIAIAVITACIVGLSLLVTSKRVRRSALLRRFSRFVPFRRTAAKVYDAMHLYGDRPGLLLSAAAVSVVAQAPLYLVYYLYAVAVGVDIELWHCALIVPPAMVIRVLPLLPAGVGQGMIAMGLLFPLVGISVEKGMAVGALGDAMFVLVCLIGGLFFLFGKTSYDELRAAATSHPEAEPN